MGHHLSQQTIGQSLRLSQAAVSQYLKRAERAGLGWPLPDKLDDAGLETLLFPPPPGMLMDQRPSQAGRPRIARCVGQT